MKMNRPIVMILVVSLALAGCGPRYQTQSFNKQKWNDGRRENPDLNVSPWMLDDLMTNHLSRGMSLTEVTNLIGHPQIRTPIGSSGVHIRGEFIEQTVYVYHPGMHNGWRLDGTNSLFLFFGQNDEYLREWSPHFPVVQPVDVEECEATRNLLPDIGLHIGNLRFAGTPKQFDALLGTPDEKRMEYQLDYMLGKRSRFAWDEVFLELHFDKNKRLCRATWSEH